MKRLARLVGLPNWPEYHAAGSNQPVGAKNSWMPLEKAKDFMESGRPPLRLHRNSMSI